MHFFRTDCSDNPGSGVPFSPTCEPRPGVGRGWKVLVPVPLLLWPLACGGGPEPEQPEPGAQGNASMGVIGSEPSAPGDGQLTRAYRNAPPLQESSVFASVREAQTLAKSGRLEQAERLLRRARKEAPGQPEVALLLGQVLIEQSKVEIGYVTTDRALADAGLELIRGVAEARPEHVPTLLILGRSYCLAKDTAAARPVLEHVLALDPDNVQAARLLGALLYENGFAVEAEKLLPPLETVDDRDFELLKLWGMVLEDQDRFEEARDAYERAVAGSPYEHRVRFKLASVLATLGLDEEADAALEQYSSLLAQKAEAKSLEDAAAAASEAGEESSSLWVQAGVARLGLDNKAAALRNFARAVRADPNNAQALTWLGVTHAKQRSLGEAKGALTEAVRLAPDSLQARRGLGEVLMAQGEAAAALAEFEAALKLVPAPPEGEQVHPAAAALEELIERAQAARDSQS